MFQIKRYADFGGNTRQWLKRFTSGTIAYMCPICYNIIYINGRYDYKITVPFIDEFNFDTVFNFECPCCKHMVKGIELDPNIAKDIRRLNIKGYKTKFCCEGHVSNKEDKYNRGNDPYIFFEDGIIIPEDILPESWYIDNIYNEDGNKVDHFIIRGDIKHYSKKKILNDLTVMINTLPDRYVFLFDETTFM